jgi:hypothetical protein
VAVKALHSESRLDEEAHQRMLREARGVSSLEARSSERLLHL